MQHDLQALTREFEDEQNLAAWLARYSKWNPANLETDGILSVSTMDFSFVHKGHPAISMLRHNKDIIGCDISKFNLIENEYFKISKSLLQQCFHQIHYVCWFHPHRNPARPRALLTLQRWGRAIPDRRRQARHLAVAMAGHARLGAASPMRALHADLLRALL